MGQRPGFHGPDSSRVRRDTARELSASGAHNVMSVSTITKRITYRLIQSAFRRRAITVRGEAGVPFTYRPAEYPVMLLGLGRVGRHIRTAWELLLQDGEVIFDIGANIGFTVQRFFSILQGQCYVHAFEPMPRNCEFLRRNTESLPPDRVVLVEAAVGKTDGQASFLDNLQHGALSRVSSSITPDSPHWESYWQQHETVTVPMVTLDSYLSEHPQVRPTFLKIDVEGAAAEVLAGAGDLLSRFKPAIMCEYHSDQERADTHRALATQGYRPVSLTQGPAFTWCGPAQPSVYFLHPDDPRVGRLGLKS